MKTTTYFKASAVLALGLSVTVSFSQTCDNSGIGTNTPTSKLHIKGCGNTGSTSSFHVINSDSKSLFHIKDDGNIGIGTTTAGTMLSIANGVDDPVNYGKAFQITNLNGRSQQMAFIRSGNNVVAAGYYGTSPIWGFGGGQPVDANFAPNYLSFSAVDGYVGVGNAAPVTLLHVNRGNYGAIYLGDNAATGHLITHEPSDNSMVFWSGLFGSGTQRLKISSSGNVGIGTSTVGYKLHVVGAGSYGEMASFQNGTYETFFATKLGAAAYNPLTVVNDNGIFWKDDATVESSNGFIIAPWASTAKGVRIDGNTGYLGVGATAPASRLEIFENVVVAAPINTSSRISTFRWQIDGNQVMSNLWLRRKALASGWLGAAVHDGISVDASFLTPGTDTRTWWERDPNANTQSWGDQAVTYMTLNAGNLGIGTATPVTNARLAVKDGHFQSQQTTAPTIAINGSGSASLSNATDVAGKMTLTPTATSTTATITFNKTFVTAPVVVITPTNSAAATEMSTAKIYVTTTTTTCVINFGAAPTTAAKTFNYMVIETQ